jgi:hypothetical protein
LSFNKWIFFSFFFFAPLSILFRVH